MYLGQGKHERLNMMEGRGNGVWVGDFNTWSKRWDGERGEGIEKKRWWKIG